MSGTIALVGGDEFRPQSAGLDRHLLSLAPRAPATVAILPSAAVPENPQLAAQHGCAHFQALGARPRPVMVLDRRDADDAGLVSALGDADLIYLTGGSPIYLLDCLRGSRAWARLLDRLRAGAVLAGSSAGAMALCEAVLYRDQRLDGLGLVGGIAVLPHFERRSASEFPRLRERAPAGLTLLGIDGATGCILREGRWQVAGAGQVTVLASSGHESHPPGAQFQLRD